MIIGIDPVPKPRMTQRDKWMKRPVVMRYREYCDKIRELGAQVPESGAHIEFCIPMPKSWSKKKREEMCGKPHQQKPDVDNLLKALLDALYEDDSGVWDIRVTKLWSDSGKITVNQ
jgi:Holliday junction resolvase RusA-like endonuclease